MSSETSRIILVDPVDEQRDILARRLRSQGYQVDQTSDPAVAADMALSAPPAALIGELWMPGISGFQLCRLLRNEPATADLPLLLMSDSDEPRNRFWAERAGANGYVHKRRTGELVRKLAIALKNAKHSDEFFIQLSDGNVDVRDRMARQLDMALFESVLAAEVRALASAGAFERLFDLFIQFLSQVTRYRWLAVTTVAPSHFALHSPPGLAGVAEAEARRCLEVLDGSPTLKIEDEDAMNQPDSEAPLVRAIQFGATLVGRIALSPCASTQSDVEWLLSLVARELGGPIRMASLVEESQRLAATDPLTSLMNRRSFGGALGSEINRSRRHGYPLTLALLDVDHFKLINDRRGHLAGDHVLASLGGLLRSELLRSTDLAGRWGGEEFVVAYLSTDAAGALIAAERLRKAVEGLVVKDEKGDPIPITVSVGVAQYRMGETLETLVDRADHAMYRSKTGGRNRVTVEVSEDRAAESVDQALPESLPDTSTQSSDEAA